MSLLTTLKCFSSASSKRGSSGRSRLTGSPNANTRIIWNSYSGSKRYSIAAEGKSKNAKEKIKKTDPLLLRISVQIMLIGCFWEPWKNQTRHSALQSKELIELISKTYQKDWLHLPKESFTKNHQWKSTHQFSEASTNNYFKRRKNSIWENLKRLSIWWRHGTSAETAPNL